jgi:hypothetical protein
MAAGAHVGIVAHITPEELAARLGHIEMANGFGNRYLYFLSKSDKVLPHTEPIPGAAYSAIEKRLRTLLTLGNRKTSRCFSMSPSAQKLWAEVYPALREDQPGLVGAMTARGSSMVLRLALIYALVDNAKTDIGAAHLKAALAVWRYSCDSVAQLFGNVPGDPLSAKVLTLLRSGPMTRTKFNAHLSADQKEHIEDTLVRLEQEGRLVKTTTKAKGAGRPATRYRLPDPQT